MGRRRRSLHLRLLIALALAGCRSEPDPRLARWGGELDVERARSIVREAFCRRAHPNPHLDRPVEDRRIVALDDERIVFRRPGASSPDQTVWFADVTAVTSQDEDGAPSRSRTILVHLAEGSRSARSADAGGDALTWIGVRDPCLALPGRDRLLVPHVGPALAFLRDRAGSGVEARAVEESLERYEAEAETRDREAEELRRLDERIDRYLEIREGE